MAKPNPNYYCPLNIVNSLLHGHLRRTRYKLLAPAKTYSISKVNTGFIFSFSPSSFSTPFLSPRPDNYFPKFFPISFNSHSLTKTSILMDALLFTHPIFHTATRVILLKYKPVDAPTFLNLQRLHTVYRISQNSRPWCSYSSSSSVFQFHIQSLSPNLMQRCFTSLFLAPRTPRYSVVNSGLGASDWIHTYPLTPFWLANSYLFFKPSSNISFCEAFFHLQQAELLPHAVPHLSALCIPR